MKEMILFNSPIYPTRMDVNERYIPPLGLGYIATQIKNAGIDVEIVDCVNEKMGISDVLRMIKSYKPKFIGLNIFTQNFDIVKEIVENCPVETHILIGGQAVKPLYEEILNWHTVNNLTIVVGEAELIIPEIMKGTCLEQPRYSKGKKQVFFVGCKSPYFPADLNAIQIDRTLLGESIGLNRHGEKESSIITSRGCVYDCAFCAAAYSTSHDFTVRYRTVLNIEEEIIQIMKLCPDLASIRVLDDLYLKSERDIFNAIKLFEKFESLSWRCMAHVISLRNSLKCLPKMKESGCKELFIGIESGSDRIRRKIKKHGTCEDVLKVVTRVLEQGIDVKGYFMLGIPSETDEDAKMTYQLASQLKVASKELAGNFRPSVFQFRPYHGTQLYNEIIKEQGVVGKVKANTALNINEERSQFNFHSGNYSDIQDELLNEYILKIQKMVRD